MGGLEKRHQMMQNLFGDQSEDEEDEVESENNDDALLRPSLYQSDEEEGNAELEVEGEGEVEGHGEAHIESELEPHEIEPDEDESESERGEKETRDLRVNSNGKRVENEEPDDFDPTFTTSTRRKSSVGHSERSDENHYAENDDEDNDHGEETAESEEHQEYGQRAATSRQRDVITSDYQGSKSNQFGKNEDEEVYQSILRRSPSDQEAKIEEGNAKSTVDIKDVIGDSDEEDPDEYEVEDASKLESFRSSTEDKENDDQGVRPEDVVHGGDMQYELEGDNIDQKLKEKPSGSPLELEAPLRRPPDQPDKMNIIRVSNIMGIEPKPFDPKTYVEEDDFVTDETGAKKRVRLEDNIVRWRSVQNGDDTMSYESNARFVRWSDGSIQLLIGNEVLDISVQEAQHDHTHLFLRHRKGILQSQGRILKKMRFMPSSLSSKSHRLLTALVDSRHKKAYKVKNCITDIDPEREKEEKEKAEGQTIRTNELLHRKRDKISRKYSQIVERGRQLSPGFLEEGLDEDDEHDNYYARHRSHRHVEEDLEEALAEKRILNAKRSQLPRNIHRSSFLSSGRSTRQPMNQSSESEREESEYERTGDEDERWTSRGRSNVLEDGNDEPEQEAEGVDVNEESDEDEKPSCGSKESKGKRKEIESNSDSSPRKPTTHRRRAVVYESNDEGNSEEMVP